LGDADGPVAADAGAGCGVLREDAAGGDAGGVEAVLQGEVEAVARGEGGGLGDGEAGELGDLDLATVDGEAHGDERGDERHRDHGERAEHEGEDALHSGILDDGGVRRWRTRVSSIAFGWVVSYARCMELLTHDELVRLTPPERLALISQLWD